RTAAAVMEDMRHLHSVLMLPAARTAAAVMEDMRHLHSVLMLPAGARKPRRRLETPSKTQEEVLRALGWRVDKGGVLQRTDA
ncbi:hypothetical protein CO151_07470, partial [bacterium CG_4_9_14_3_um_filter_65_15]